jgi:hypothetical protein
MRLLIFFLAFSATCIADIPTKEHWPSKVTLLKNLKVDQILPNGIIKKEFKEGDKVDLVSLSGNKIEIRSGIFTATLPLADTDFLELSKSNERAATAAKIQREKEELERIRFELTAIETKVAREKNAKKRAGDPVLKSDGDGVSLDPAIYRAIKEKLKDPDSFQARKLLSKNLMKLDDESYIWHIKLRYGAKNGFGGYSAGNATVLYRAGKAAIYEMD